MDKNVLRWMERLPYPAVLLTKEKKNLYRNRFAKCLLPTLPNLKACLFDDNKPKDTLLKEMTLGGIVYLVVSLPAEDDSVLFCFFEHFMPLQEALSRAIVGKMQDFFWELLDKEELPESSGLVHPDQIAARAVSLRMHGDDYLRLLNANDVFCDSDPQSCSLGGFFGHLQRALGARGIDVSFRFPSDATVLSEGEVLSFLVLNLVHFVHLFEGEQCADLSVTEEGEALCFSTKFSDGGSVAASIERLIRFGKEEEKLLFVLPLLCILRVCMERGIPWSAGQSGDRFSFSFRLPKGDEKPVLFLSDATSEEVSLLLQMVKSIFSR